MRQVRARRPILDPISSEENKSNQIEIIDDDDSESFFFLNFNFNN